MKIRLKEIAEITGYSVNTISHALRDEPDISTATKEKIRAVAAELGYIPNMRASSIKTGKSHIISIILPDIINPHFTIVFRQIENFFRKVGYTPFFMNTNEDLDSEMNAVRISIGQNVDGVILCPTQISTEPVELLRKSQIPFVLIGRHFPEIPDANSVVCDDTNGAYLATQHLISLGHRSIACVKVDAKVSSNFERFDGYRRALEEAAISFDPTLTLNLALTGNDNAASIRDFFAAKPECTAVLSFNDSLAYAVISELQKIGRRVPEDISVIGFDNICSDYVFPTELSSVSVSKKTMAISASELLYRLMNGEPDEEIPDTRQMILPSSLFLRATTGDARKEK